MAHKNNLYPHLLAEDIELWEEFLEIYAPCYTSFEYDIRVGDGREAGEQYPDYIRKMSLNLTQRRIDVVAQTAKAVHLIEITLSAGFTCIGQCWGYPILYRLKFQPTKPVIPLILTRKVETDIQPILDAHGIHCCVIPHDHHTTLPGELMNVLPPSASTP